MEPVPRATLGVLFGAWLSLVERSVRDREAAGSNPVAPTTNLTVLRPVSSGESAFRLLSTLADFPTFLVNGHDHILIVRDAAPPLTAANVSHPEAGVAVQLLNEAFIEGDGRFWRGGIVQSAHT